MSPVQSLRKWNWHIQSCAQEVLRAYSLHGYVTHHFHQCLRSLIVDIWESHITSWGWKKRAELDLQFFGSICKCKPKWKAAALYRSFTWEALKGTFFSVGETLGIAFGHPLRVEEVAQEKNNHTPRLKWPSQGPGRRNVERCYISI